MNIKVIGEQQFTRNFQQVKKKDRKDSTDEGSRSETKWYVSIIVNIGLGIGISLLLVYSFARETDDSPKKGSTEVETFGEENDSLEKNSAEKDDSLEKNSAEKGDSLETNSVEEDDFLESNSAEEDDSLEKNSAEEDDILKTNPAELAKSGNFL